MSTRPLVADEYDAKVVLYDVCMYSAVIQNVSRNQEIMDCLEEGTEGCLTLVGSVGRRHSWAF